MGKSDPITRRADVDGVASRSASVIEREFLTPAECAEHLGVCRRTIYDAIRSGRLPAMRLGGRHYRVERQALSLLLTPYEAGKV